MKLRMLVVSVVLLLAALPAQAKAGSVVGVVVAKQPARGTLVLAGAHGAGLTVRGGLARVAVGDRISISGVRLHDGSIRLVASRVLSRVRRTTVRATVVRVLARATLVAAGRSVITIRPSVRRLASADDGGLRVGTVADFRVRFDDDELVELAPPVPVAQASTVGIEGAVVSVSPFVVSVEGLPVTITIPSGTALPSGLAPGQRIELTVQIGAGNVFTFVAVDEVENENQPAAAQEVEVKGFVVTSTSSQIVVSSGGMTFTFVAPAGVTLPTFATGAFVEVRGFRLNGTLTVERVRLEDGDSGGDGGGDGHGGRH